jgi:hypothetical protein
MLIPAGAFGVWRTWRRDRRYAGLAALPMLLGFQQFAEGMIWVAGAQNGAAIAASWGAPAEGMAAAGAETGGMGLGAAAPAG